MPEPDMNDLSYPATPEDVDELNLTAGEAPSGWQMKVLKPKHKQVASLLAQGARNVDIAKMLEITPEYVSMLSRQPLMQAYIRQMCEVTGHRLEALFEKSVDVIASTLRDGTEAGKLKAARLQLEATKRIGRYDPSPTGGGGAEERLVQLAERLIFLQSGKRPPGVYSETGEEITEAEFSEPASSGLTERAQEDGPREAGRESN